MMLCYTQPRFRCLILCTLFLFLTRGLSQEINITYIGSEKVYENEQIIFEGFVNATGLSSTWQISKVVFRENDTAPTSSDRICDVNFLFCLNTSTLLCYCSKKVDDVYYFALGVTAEVDKRGKCIHAQWENYNSTAVCYPEILLQTTVSPTTDTITGSTDINNTVTKTGTKGDSTTPKHGEPDCDNLPWIILGSVGGFVLLGFVILFIFCYCCLPKGTKDGHVKDGNICCGVFDFTCCNKKSIGVTPRSEAVSPTTTTTTFTSEDPPADATTSPSPTLKPDSLPPIRGERPLPSPRNPNM